MATVPLLICGLMLLLVTPSGAVICYECTYSSNSDGQMSACGQLLNPTGVATCSGSGCYAYIYNTSEQGYSAIVRGCGDLPINASSEQCLLNSQVLNNTFFLMENQCCYNMTEENWAVTSCFCDEDYCNYNISQTAMIKQANSTSTAPWYGPQNVTASSNPSTMSVPLNPNNTFNNSGLITCYDCLYWESAINASDESPCSPQANSREGKVCSGVACETYSYIYTDYVYTLQQCIDNNLYAEILSYCQNNSQAYGLDFFFEGDLCCYSYQGPSDAVKSCLCASDYCNNFVLQPTLISQSNDTATTASLEHSENTTYHYNSPTTPVPLNFNDTLNNSSLVTCYSCRYSGIPDNISMNSSCEKPLTSSVGGSCSGEACATFSSASEGYLEVSRACMDSQQYTNSLERCQNNTNIAGRNFFFHENQCCFSDTYGGNSNIACFCTDNYCNNKLLQPSAVSQSNAMTTSPWYNPNNATASSQPANESPANQTNTSQLTTGKPTTTARSVIPLSETTTTSNLIAKAARSSALYSKPTMSLILISVVYILAFVKVVCNFS